MRYQEFKERFIAEITIISDLSVEDATVCFEASFDTNTQGEAVDMDGDLAYDPEEAAHDECSYWDDDEDGEESD